MSKVLADVSVNGRGYYGLGAPAVPFSDELFTYLRITDINDDGTININGLMSVNDEKATEYRLKPNDIVFARTGASTGRNYFYDEDDGDFVYAGFLIKFSLDPQKINPKFVKYYCQSEQYRQWINSFNTGSTRGNINAKTLAQMPIPDLPKKKQDALVEILDSLDKKIRCNKLVNQNLTEQFMALYKQLLTSDSKHKQVELQSLCLFQEGYVNPAQTHPEYFDGDVKWLRAVDINESFIIDTSRTITKAGFESAKKSALLFKPWTIAISKSGTIGRLGIVADYMCGNRAVINIEVKEKENFPFIYAYLKSRQNEFAEMAVGSVQKNLYISLLEPLIIDIPENSDLSEFNNIGKAMLNEIYNNCFENKRLSDLRDSLLPKLMSGELDVSSLNA